MMGGGHTPKHSEAAPHHPHPQLTTRLSLIKKPSMNNMLAVERPLQRKSSMMLPTSNYLNESFMQQVRENSRQSISRSENGEVKINQYLIKELIGRGAFA